MKFSLTILISNCLGLVAPPPGKVYLSAWLDTADSLPKANDGDRPLAFNKRLGFNASAFHYAQNMPVTPYEIPVEQIEALSTNAIVYMTVYPKFDPWTINDTTIDALATQCQKLNAQNRSVIMRFAPEMNGPWNQYGVQPARYKELWIKVYNSLKQKAPLTSMMWAPSSGNGYPYAGGKFPDGQTPTDADIAQLDTNGDGTFAKGDNPYSPYYPGDDYVDWIGYSIYHYGTAFPWETNVYPAPGKFENWLRAGEFYQTYAQGKQKPFAIAETAASFHLRLYQNEQGTGPFTVPDPGPGELEIKRSWWRQYLTNATFLDAFPEVKLINLFEFAKLEETTFRDFRISNNSEILDAFKADLETVKDRFVFAQYVPPPVPSTTRVGSTATNTPKAGSVGISVLPLIFGVLSFCLLNA